MFKRLACLATVLACAAAAAFAQQNPRGAASTSVGGKKLAVDYGRPALKGRSLDELLKQLPADRMWRAGENQVSTISLEGDAMIGGKKVAAGKYSVYVHAGENKQWELVLNRDLGIAARQDLRQGPGQHEERALAAHHRLHGGDRQPGGRAHPDEVGEGRDAGRYLHDLVRARRQGPDDDARLGRPGLVDGSDPGEVTASGSHPLVVDRLGM